MNEQLDNDRVSLDELTWIILLLLLLLFIEIIRIMVYKTVLNIQVL